MPSHAEKPRAPFTLGAAVERDGHARPFDQSHRLRAGHRGSLPATRRLTVFTQDPGTPRMHVSTAEAAVPFEPLDWGPDGAVVKVIDSNETTGEVYEPVDLDRLGITAPLGLPASTTDPRFAQQMAYAVTMATYDRFRQALSRTPDFAFPAERADEPAAPDGALKLHVYPHAMEEDNACYDPDRGALLFGYTFANRRAGGLNQPGGIVFTSLSHDVVVHEMTHALLDGMRARFLLPSNPDVDAFHEAFSDLVALFQRFQFRELVVKGIAQAPGDLSSRLLTDVARQWGQTTGDGRAALRSALVDSGPLDAPVKREYRYSRKKEAHDLGAVLVAAVFDAFRWIFTQKTATLRRLAGPAAVPSAELVELLAAAACRIAGQFLNILIRAVDYCPPVDVTFGEFLRALITADFDVVPEDPWGYREALVQAFRRYGITVDGVPDLSEGALLWRCPEVDLPPIKGLAFSELAHGREPGEIPPTAELTKRALALGTFVTTPEHLRHFGLAPADARKGIERPSVESIRALRRIGADNTVRFEQVGEIVQRRRVGGRKWFYGGATVIIDADGVVRYAIAKNVMSPRREQLFGDDVAKMPALYSKMFGDHPPQKVNLLRHLHRGPDRQRAGNKSTR